MRSDVYVFRMATPVYLWPMYLLGGVYADLHGGNIMRSGFQRQQVSVSNQGRRLEQVTYKFNFETPLVDGGRIQMDVSGRVLEGDPL